MGTKDHQQNLSWLEPMAIGNRKRGCHGEIDVPINFCDKNYATMYIISLVSLQFERRVLLTCIRGAPPGRGRSLSLTTWKSWSLSLSTRFWTKLLLLVLTVSANMTSYPVMAPNDPEGTCHTMTSQNEVTERGACGSGQGKMYTL